MQYFYSNPVLYGQAQYRLIYDTLALHVQAWTTVVPSSRLPTVTQKLSLKDPHTHMQGFEREFKVNKLQIHASLHVKCIEISPCISTIFSRGNTFYDFLTSLDNEALPKQDMLKGKNILNQGPVVQN